MQPNEPSRTALMIARQRAAHQVLDHGSILDDPFAMKILRGEENRGQTERSPVFERMEIGERTVSPQFPSRWRE
jgi:O-methyltransferase involved in polyketide biosynthesis